MTSYKTKWKFFDNFIEFKPNEHSFRKKWSPREREQLGHSTEYNFINKLNTSTGIVGFYNIKPHSELRSRRHLIAKSRITSTVPRVEWADYSRKENSAVTLAATRAHLNFLKYMAEPPPHPLTSTPPPRGKPLPIAWPPSHFILYGRYLVLRLNTAP